MIHPYFASIADFFLMGHYAQFVWPAYAIVFFVLILLLWFTNRRYQKIKAKIKAGQ